MNNSFLKLGKNKLGTLVIAFTLFLSVSGMAQSKKSIAQEHIKNLKNGVLLVQLRNHQSYRERLIELGKTALAEKDEAFEEEMNQKLLEDFSKNFGFCPVYFFDGSNIEEIKSGNYANYLLDSNLQPVAFEKLDQKIFDYLYFVGIRRLKTDTEFNKSRKEGIVMMDSNLKQMEHPFPTAMNHGLAMIYRMTWTSRAKKRRSYENWYSDYGEKEASLAKMWSDRLATYYDWYFGKNK